MRVEVTEDACTGHEAMGPLLNLIRCFVEGRHEWMSTPQTVLALERFFRESLPPFAPTVRDLGQKSAVDLAWSSGAPPAAVRIAAHNLVDATDDLCRHAVLVVEDIQNDTCFVRAVARIFGATRVLTALDRKWLEVRHSGGTGRMALIAVQAKQDFRLVVRVVVLADSDRLFPGHEVPHHAKMDDLKSQGIAVHLLAMREAENYVPNKVLAASGSPASAARTLTRLKTLRAEQRAHFDVKHGFGRPQEPPRIPRSQRDLFEDLPHEARLDLRGGFGDKLLPLFDEHASRLTVADFAALGPDVVAELHTLLSVVESVI